MQTRWPDAGSSTVDQSLLDDLRDQLLARLKGRLQKIVLYGSHARGTGDLESDLDVLVMVDSNGRAILEQVRRARYDVMQSHGYTPLISILLLTNQEWQELSQQSAGLKHNIEHEGLTLWPLT